MPKPSDNLIFDRTQADVNQVKSLTKKLLAGTATGAEEQEWLSAMMKGAWNYTDFNRIEEWTEYLSERLRSQGYSITVLVKTDWAKEDFPTRPEVDRIRANVAALQESFYSLPDWREIVYNNTMDFNQANALEWDLQTIYNWLMRMVAAFVYCGELHAGEV